MSLKYKRALLKLSGEALRGEQPSGFDGGVLEGLAGQLQQLHEIGAEIGVVIGGGNFFRGGKAQMPWLKRNVADQVGMLATVMNGLVLRELCLEHGLPCALFSAVPIPGVADGFSYDQVRAALAQRKILIFGGGTGHPFFTTDTTAALRAREIDAQILIKATQVDGVYDADPHLHPDAKRFDQLSYLEALERNLRVMDATGVSFCREYRIPIRVMNISKPDHLKRAMMGESIGTLIHAESQPEREKSQ